MERPDTVIELHRTVVQNMFFERLPPQSVQKPFQQSVATGTAILNLVASRVWFHVDASGRRWRRRVNGAAVDLERHLAFDLELGDHAPELGLADSKLVFETVLGLPAPTFPASSCEGRQIAPNEIPLYGRLVIHDSMERVESSAAGQLQQNVVLEFGPQAADPLEADVAAPGFDAQMFGPGVQAQAGGRVLLTGTEPRVVWELTPAEQACIRQTPVGRLLVLQGIDPVATIATELARGVVDTLATAGDNGTSTASVLPAAQAVDPTGASGDPLAIDAMVRLWQRQGALVPEESLQIQVQTVPDLPEALPASVLALSIDETVGFMRANWAILRSIRRSQIASLCLGEDDFEPDEGCRLRDEVGIEVNGEDATLTEFSATIEPDAALGEDLLQIRGRAEGEAWHSGWYIEFGLPFRLQRGDAPRDPLPGELPPELQPSRTLAEMNARLGALAADKCAGGDRDAIEEEQEEIAAEKAALPTEVGVKPDIHGQPYRDSDGWITPLGLAAGIALVVGAAIGGLAIVAWASVSVAFTVASVTATFLIGYGVAIIGLAVLDDVYIDCKVSDGLTKFINDKSTQSGDSLPLEGYAPTTVLLKDGFLRVFLAELPRAMSVRWFQPDTRRPLGDPDYVAQQVAGLLPDGQRLWRLSVADAAHLIERGRISLTLDPAVAGGQAVPLYVARSSRGRRYLRARADDAGGNNLARLPPIPS